MMMKIALITPMLQPYRITFYEKLAFSDLRYELKVFHGISNSEDGRPNYRGKTKFQNSGFSEKKYFIGPFKIVYNKGMFSEIKRYNPDLVILQGIAGDITNRLIINWAYRKKKKIILWTAGWDPGLAKGRLLSLKNHFVSTFFRKANIHLTYGSKASDYVKSMGVLSENITTCYNGIELDHLIAEEKQILDESKQVTAKYELDDHTTFLYVGGLIQEKRVDLLLSAFSVLRKKYPGIKLLIVGDGPLREQIQNMIADLDDNHIYYLGRIIDGVDPIFAASDCLVLPGIGGLALNQAMFWGLPCIVSSADGTEDDLVIENVSGYRFIKDSLESLTDAMERRITSTSEDISKLSDKSKEIIRTKSNVNNMVDVFLKGITDCLSDS